METPRCEMCGELAIVRIVDVKEGDPVKDAKGRLWTTWKPDSPAHFLCKKHQRHSRRTFREETPVYHRYLVTLEDFYAETMCAVMVPPEIAGLLERIAHALERIAPPSPAPLDFTIADAFVWQPNGRRLAPVARVNRVEMTLLRGIDRVRDILEQIA